jgi:uncharacterized protein YciI
MERVFVALRSRGAMWDDAKPLEGQKGDALLVLRASSESEIVERLAADPWTMEGLLVTKQINPWQLRLGPLT